MGTSPRPLDDAPERCPKYLKLAKGFERQLEMGSLRIGDRLPSVRQLRQEHRVSLATAVSCYAWLERQGYVRARPKSGFFVSRVPIPEGPTPDIVARPRGPFPVRLAASRAEAVPVERPAEPLRLGPAVVGPALLPMNRLNRSLRLALSAFADHAIRPEDPRGELRLRRQIARICFRQGITCSSQDVLVTAGETEATSLALRVVARPGDVVALESPGCYEVLQALEAYGLRAVEIPHMPGEGIDLRLLAAEARRRRIAALLLSATCHNALGDCASEGSKAELVALATRLDLPIVEGDPFGDLVWSRERPRALKAFDTAGVVIHCGSLAHHLAPGFNLGWINAGRWHAAVERLRTFGDLALPRLPQLALAEFLESGAFEKHLRQLRLALWRSVEASRTEILRTFPPGTRVSRPEGGFVLWVQLPEGYDGLELQRAAAAVGIEILAGELFSAAGQYTNCVRIACGHPFETLRPALLRLVGLLKRARGREGRLRPGA